MPTSAFAPGPRGFTAASRFEVRLRTRLPLPVPISLKLLLALPTVQAFGPLPPGLLCPLLIPAPRYASSRWHRSQRMGQRHRPPGVSRIPYADLRYTTAEFTLPALGGYGLRCLTPTRPAGAPNYPVPVRRLVPLLHAAFRPRLAATPLRFTSLHLHQVGMGTFTPPVSRHARHA